MGFRNVLSLWTFIGCSFAREFGSSPSDSNLKRNLGFEVTYDDGTFDGSLEDLYDLAEEKAAENAPSGSPSSYPSSVTPVSDSPTVQNVERDSTVISCQSAYDSIDEIAYRYAVEYISKNDVVEILTSLERLTNQYLADIFLSCTGSKRTKKQLPEKYGLVALDSNPVDETDTTAFCGASLETNDCVVVRGQMRVFIGSEGHPDAVEPAVREEIQKYFNSTPSIPGLIAVSYLGVEGEGGTSNTTEPPLNPDRLGASSSSQLSSRSVIIFAFAGAAFVVSIGVAVWFRRYKGRRMNRGELVSGDSQVTSTKDESPNVMNIDTMDSGSYEEPDALSPFSKMLPAAYRLDDGHADMSVILESAEGSSANDRASSILLSEGYSTEGESSDVENSNLNFSNYSTAPVLGATPRGEIQSLVDV